VQPTALVHEAYLRLVAQNLPDCLAISGAMVGGALDTGRLQHPTPATWTISMHALET